MPSIQRSTKLQRTRCGSTTVELAIVCPLLTLLILGCLDYARSISTSMSITSATRIGAEYAATHRFTVLTRTAWETKIRSLINQELAIIPNYDPQQTTVTLDTTLDSQDVVRITIGVECQFRTVIPWPTLPNVVVIKQSVAMRQIR